MECTERLSGGKYFPGIVRSEDCSFVHSREIETSYIQTDTLDTAKKTPEEILALPSIPRVALSMRVIYWRGMMILMIYRFTVEPTTTESIRFNNNKNNGKYWTVIHTILNFFVIPLCNDFQIPR